MRRDRAASKPTRDATGVEYLLMALLIATATFAVVALAVVSAFG